MYAIFKNDKQISKAYPTRIQAVIEAFERGFIYRLWRRDYLFDGFTIKEIL